MDRVKVVYGSSSGCTESAARRIASAFGVEAVEASKASASDFQAELLILGSSTWGAGELQDDWLSALPLLKSVDLSGTKVAVFGFGDQNGFSDTFCDALGILAETASRQGAEIVGKTSSDGYAHARSAAESDGMFCGLALDDVNESEKTEARISAWIEELKSA